MSTKKHNSFSLLVIACLLVCTALACEKRSQEPSPTPGSQSGSTTVKPTQPAESPTETSQDGLTGGGLPAGLTEGDNELSTIYAGVERTYILHISPGFDNSHPTPLVLAFHGVGLNAREMIRISDFSSQADASGFLVVYPEGTGTTKSWNGGHCCGTAARDNIDDVGFVRALVGEISSTLNIDFRRIYATGFSNGAILVYRLACELSDLLAAVGPISATQVLDDQQVCHPQNKISLIHFHGTADDPNPYEGGVTQAGFQFIPVRDAIHFWVEFNACPAEPQTSTTGSIIHEVYSPCDSDSEVELYTITRGRHAWPGGEAVNQTMGEPNMEISATNLMWEFFINHPKP